MYRRTLLYNNTKYRAGYKQLISYLTESTLVAMQKMYGIVLSNPMFYMNKSVLFTDYQTDINHYKNLYISYYTCVYWGILHLNIHIQDMQKLKGSIIKNFKI